MHLDPLRGTGFLNMFMNAAWDEVHYGVFRGTIRGFEEVFEELVINLLQLPQEEQEGNRLIPVGN